MSNERREVLTEWPPETVTIRASIPISHEDAALLRGVAGDYEGRSGFMPTGTALMDLAARLEALLHEHLGK